MGLGRMAAAFLSAGEVISGLWRKYRSPVLPGWAFALMLLLLALSSSQAEAASACPSPRSISVIAGQEYYEDYTNAPCSQFGLTGTLVEPLHGTLENSNATNAVRYLNTNQSATSDTFTVRDDVGQPIVYNVTITSAITLSPASVPNATVSQAYSTTLSAAGGAAPYSYAVTAGGLPAGMTLSPAGGLTGTPTAGGMFNFTVRATDSLAVNGTRTYALTVGAPTIGIAPATLPAFSQGTPFSQAITATGGTAAYSFAVTAGSVPTGLTLGAGGSLSGTPTASGPYSFTVTATDSSTGAGPYSGARAYSGTVAAGAPAAGNVSASVGYGSGATAITLDLTGGAATSVAVATNASHGTATAGGTSITYTPTPGYGGPDSFTYTATNGFGTSAAATVAVTVGGPTITVGPMAVPAAAVGMAYSQSITAAGGAAPYTYAISAGALPAGLNLSPTGLLSGTPTAGGVFNFTVGATDSSTGFGPYSVARAYSLTVAAPTVAVAPASLPNPAVAVAYTQAVTASGGTAPYTYTVTSGALPTGLALSAGSGAITGTPTATGSFTFTINATVSSTGTGAPFNGSQSYTAVVASANADLSALALGSGTLAPSFEAGTMAYAATVPTAVDSITVTPTVAFASATVKVNGATVASAAASALIALNVGSNTITVEVTAQDGTTKKTYTLTVTRAPLQSVGVAPGAPGGTPGAGMGLDVANNSPTCTITNWQFSDPATPPAPLPTGYSYPYAMVDFTAKQCVANSSLTVTLTFPNPVPGNAVLMKYNAAATPKWQPFTPTITGNQVSYTIMDGGLHDDDKLANGEFVDPVVLAMPLAAPGGAVGIPVLGPWGLALLSLLAALAGAAGLARGRQQMG